MRKEVKIGIFALVVLGILYWGINFLKGRDLFSRTNTFYAYYDNVSGIQNSSPIIIRGINAGMVTGMKFRPDMNNSVEVRFDVKSGYEIPDNSIVKLFSNGFIGGKALEIVLGNSQHYLPDGATIKSESESSLLEIAGSEIDVLKKQLYGVMTELDLTLKNVNGILEDNKDRIAGTMEGLQQGAQAFGDKGDDLKQIIDNINNVTRTLSDNSGKMGSAISNLETISGDLADADLASTVANLNKTVNGLNEVLVSINTSEGTAGMLLKDKALYESLTQASENLSSLLENLQANPKRYVHFSLFGGGKNK